MQRSVGSVGMGVERNGEGDGRGCISQLVGVQKITSETHHCDK